VLSIRRPAVLVAAPQTQVTAPARPVVPSRVMAAAAELKLGKPKYRDGESGAYVFTRGEVRTGPGGRIKTIHREIFRRVREGDTLSRYAKEFASTVDFIQGINGVKNANRLEIGQKLRMPARNYYVRPGDTLKSIARMHATTERQLHLMNELGDLNGQPLPANTWIRIPLMGC
jgi:hypothetical protein